MWNWRAPAAVGTVLIGLGALVGCATVTPAAPRPCTEMGAPTGISITLVQPPAPTAREVLVTVCDAPGTCTDTTVRLRPGGTTVDLGCSGTAPSAPCSGGQGSPDGTLIGFVDRDGLTTDPVTVTITLDSGGRGEQRLGPYQVTPTRFHPNGPDCDAGALQGSVRATIPS